MNIFYLHGFASSPGTKKGQIFKKLFAERGIDLRLPDLNVPDFEHLSFTAILAKIHDEIRAAPDGDVILIGSSLGGGAALHYADRYQHTPEGERVKKLVLLAPSINSVENWNRRLGEEGLHQWRETRWHNTYNYALSSETAVHYAFFEDLRDYNGYEAQIDLPILIVHGTRDDVVPPAQSIKFASTRPNVDLRLVDSDHELLDQTDTIWAALLEFLALT
jgi:pimeloyl-ACP methyl ester carboxylesterase